MIIHKENETEYEGHKIGPNRTLTVQDAVVIIIIYATQIDPSNNEEEIRRIEGIAENCPICVEKKEGIFSRINLFVNEIKIADREKALEAAIKVLTPEFRKEAFELVAEIIMTGDDQPNQKNKILEELVFKMSIDKQFASKVVEQFNK